MLDLRGSTLLQTRDYAVKELAVPAYRGEQLWRWVHKNRASSFDEMTNLPQTLRDTAKDFFTLSRVNVDFVQTSRDGTKKIRFQTWDGHFIESVLIRFGDKLTQCISSQIGCAMGCDFCATAKMKLKRNLLAGEIVDQVYQAMAILEKEKSDLRLTNLVYMGMGEPLHNYEQVIQSLQVLTSPQGLGMSYRKITVSSVGLVPGIARLAKEDGVRPNLAISLNAVTDPVRNRIMPVNKKWNIEALLACLHAYPVEHRRRITLEYVLLEKVNDSIQDARALSKLTKGLPCKINIIPWNPHPDAPYKRPSDQRIQDFQNEAKRCGLDTYLRMPKGDDIDAACGQLANRGNSGSNSLPIVS